LSCDENPEIKMQVYLEFEKPIAEMEGKIAELRAIS
jgi:hypothetical protein